MHEGLIEYLRTAHGVNIASARELGYTARDDEFQFREAKRQRRFLLTCDKDFLNHSAFPFHQMVGVVILDVPQWPLPMDVIVNPHAVTVGICHVLPPKSIGIFLRAKEVVDRHSVLSAIPVIAV